MTSADPAIRERQGSQGASVRGRRKRSHVIGSNAGTNGTARQRSRVRTPCRASCRRFPRPASATAPTTCRPSLQIRTLPTATTSARCRRCSAASTRDDDLHGRAQTRPSRRSAAPATSSSDRSPRRARPEAAGRSGVMRAAEWYYAGLSKCGLDAQRNNADPPAPIAMDRANHHLQNRPARRATGTALGMVISLH